VLLLVFLAGNSNANESHPTGFHFPIRHFNAKHSSRGECMDTNKLPKINLNFEQGLCGLPPFQLSEPFIAANHQQTWAAAPFRGCTSHLIGVGELGHAPLSAVALSNKITPLAGRKNATGKTYFN